MLSAFDLAIHHRPGSLNGRADVLSRRVDVTDGTDKEPRPFLRLAYLERLEPVWTDARVFTQIKKSLREDSKLRQILAFFESNPEAAPANIRRRFQAYTWEDGLLRFEGAVFVPDHEELRRQILRSRHDAPAAGHQGRAKTLELVSRDFYWPTLCRYVHCYVDDCDTCQRSKPTHHARYGLLQPIPATDAPWKKVTVDFIVKLPMSSA